MRMTGLGKILSSKGALHKSVYKGKTKLQNFIWDSLNTRTQHRSLKSSLNLKVEVAERLRAPNSNSGVSDQQSVGSNPQP